MRRDPTIRLAARPWVALVLAITLVPAVGYDAESWAQIIIEQARDGSPMPLLSDYDAGLDLETAYAIQRAFVEQALETRTIAGYKAGFTSAESREKFGLDAPIAGVLFADGMLTDGAELDLGDFRSLMVEIEIGFVLRSPITRRMRSVGDLRTYVSEAVPAIELPDLNYENLDRLRGLDVVATNIASGHYLVGAPLPLTDIGEVDELEARLYRDDALIDEGRGSNALGGQLEALLWLVNTVHGLGWPLEAGQLLLTGTLGRINPAAAGAYRGDYGSSRVHFRITERSDGAHARRK